MSSEASLKDNYSTPHKIMFWQKTHKKVPFINSGENTGMTWQFRKIGNDIMIRLHAKSFLSLAHTRYIHKYVWPSHYNLYEKASERKGAWQASICLQERSQSPPHSKWTLIKFSVLLCKYLGLYTMHAFRNCRQKQ
jgi:hypothetical protein